jgi:hypothetical protein
MIGSYTEFKTVSCLGSSIPTLSAESSLVRRCDLPLDRAALGLLSDCPQYQVKEVTTRATVRRSWGVERDIDLYSGTEQGNENLKELHEVIKECGCREGDLQHPYVGCVSEIHIIWD